MLAEPIDADAVYGVPGGQLSADGMTLFTNASDSIVMWSLDPAVQADAACDLAGREFSTEEWSTYFPGEEQVATCAVLAA